MEELTVPMPTAKCVVRMREASGGISSDDSLVKFLYLLARGEVTTGVIDQVIDFNLSHGVIQEFTNGWLALWAMDTADRLRTPPRPPIIRGETEAVVEGAGTPPKRRFWHRKKPPTDETVSLLPREHFHYEGVGDGQ